jgi:hypothetical protein
MNTTLTVIDKGNGEIWIRIENKRVALEHKVTAKGALDLIFAATRKLRKAVK